MRVAFVLYPGFTALGLVGAYEVISRWPRTAAYYLATSLAPVCSDRGLTMLPTQTPATMGQPDLIVVPGSGDALPADGERALVTWLREAAPGCQWTASVCTGASLYAAAGLLDGRKTATHWAFRDIL